MNLRESLNRIESLMSFFATQVKAANSAGRTDINKNAETVLIPLLTEVYGYKNLKNLNVIERPDYPGIDLGDKVAKVAFQITSTPGIDKVKDTLQKFADYELYQKYDRLIIYILTERQKSYSETACKSIIQGRFAFNPDEDILDYRDILKNVEGFQIDQVRRIEHILEANFGEGKTLLFPQTEEQFTETVHLNLLELFFPQTLYIADFDKGMVSLDLDYEKKIYRRDSPGKIVQEALEQHGLQFGVGWEYYRNQILTFHDLRDEDLPLAQVIDKNTVTPLKPEMFYSVDENHERVFKTLLGRCLQQKLYHQRVLWQHEDKLFIFADWDGEARRTEQWRSGRTNNREVYVRVMKTDKPDEILRCKHLGFKTQYKCFGDQWYLLIKPDWFFSYDGYQKSYYGSDNIDWLKRHESNDQVFNHLRFIVYFLTHPDIFVEKRTHSFLSFGKLLSLDSALALDDNDWNPPDNKEEDRSEQIDSGQVSIFDL